MKRLILKTFLVLDIFVFLTLTVFSQFLIRYNTVSGITTDGFGRELKDAPMILKSTGLIDEWAGIIWFLVDTFCAVSLIVIAYLLFQAIIDRKN